MKKFFSFWLIALTLFGIGGGSSSAALTPNAEYTITVQKMNSNGTVSDYATTTATADGNGKLSFSLSSMPTNAEANFIVFIIRDANGNLVRKGFVPAPPVGRTNMVGINDLSTVQTNAVLAAGEAAGTDDPIAMAFLLVLLRSPEATENDAIVLAALGKDAIIGSGGFEGFLVDNGVTLAQLNTFKSKLIYNGTSGKKTIADLTASFKTAVDSGSTTTATEEMQKAGGFMADVFMDAAEAASIDFTLILAAHDAAGEVAGNATNQARMNQLSSSVKQSIEQSMSSFFRRIASVKVKSEYTNALSTLNASGSQVDNYLSAVQTMMAANANIDATYGEYFQNPDSYVSSHGTTHEAVRAVIDQAFQNSFGAFQTNITSSDAEITAMKANVASAFNINQSYLPSDFGTYRDFTGGTKNWPIPQVVMVNWMASIIAAGGSFEYTRDTLTIPSMIQSWMGNCSDNNYYEQMSCEANSGIWTPGRRTYNTPSSAFNAYLGLQEDIQIIEFSRYAIYQGSQPSREQQKQAKLTFQQRMAAAAGRISGTTDGTTSISDAQKHAVIKLLVQPSMN